MRRKFRPRVDPEAKRQSEHARRLVDRIESYLRPKLDDCYVGVHAVRTGQLIEIHVYDQDADRIGEELVVRNLPATSFTSKQQVERLLTVARVWRDTRRKQ